MTGSFSIDATWVEARKRLIAQLDPRGCWPGVLPLSSLATAVAVSALDRLGERHRERVARGRAWLVAHANPDGGWGDTVDSPSNLPTTLLCWGALNVGDPGVVAANAAAERWLIRRIGGLQPEAIARAVAQTYGQDLTFTAPLLAQLALMGRLGPEPACWKLVAQLPCELAALPRGLWPWLRLGVVSYGLPALVTIGLIRHRRLPGPRPWRWLREATIAKSLRVIETMWPDGPGDEGRMTGGYNEAPPLIGFVLLGLAAAGLADHPVAKRCERYLCDWQDAAGGWAVEAHLRTWVTSLAVAALASGAEPGGGLDGVDVPAVRAWLLGCQKQVRDATTRAAPGGWAWNELVGSMPDGDDTSGALLALRCLGATDPAGKRAALAGADWLTGIQNADGGIPTFCRGWGKLPFDRSCPDLTAHALRGWSAWIGDAGPVLARRLARAAQRAERYLAASQRADGAWVPLWFGNQAAPRLENPVYGTAQVVLALQCRPPAQATEALIRRGAAWLIAAQGADGGWGGDANVPPSIEETALAVAALAGSGLADQRAAALRGAAWLCARTHGGTVFPSAPIGLYFAQLWYGQALYPHVWTVLALGRLRRA